MVQVVALENDKKGTIVQGEEVDKKSTSGNGTNILYKAVENDPDEETSPHPKSCTEPKFSRIVPPTSAMTGVAIIKNTTEKVEMKDTGQYYDTHDMIMVKDVRGEVIMTSINLDTTASEVYGVQTIVIYILDKEAKVVYNRKSWD